MSHITVQKLNPSSPAARLLVEEIEQTHRAIEQRAFDRFQERGSAAGDPVQDWLNAEQEMLAVPAIQVDHWQDHFEIHLVVKEIPLEHLSASVLPDSIIIHAEPGSNGKPVLRRIFLPEEIDPQSVRAVIREGALRITAEKRTVSSASQSSNFRREPTENSVAA